MATRLYQNTARVHFNQLQQRRRGFGQAHHLRRPRHLAWRTRSRSTGSRTLLRIARAGTPARTPTRRSPATRCSPGPTCSSASTSGATTSARCGCGSSPSRTSIRRAEDVPLKVAGDDGRERYHPNVVLDLDYIVLMPKRARRGAADRQIAQIRLGTDTQTDSCVFLPREVTR